MAVLLLCLLYTWALLSSTPSLRGHVQQLHAAARCCVATRTWVRWEKEELTRSRDCNGWH
eukprot:366406-Chlamydomonas_euryale.AAC.6